jgi:hypothetical protein
VGNIVTAASAGGNGNSQITETASDHNIVTVNTVVGNSNGVATTALGDGNIATAAAVVGARNSDAGAGSSVNDATFNDSPP